MFYHKSENNEVINIYIANGNLEANMIVEALKNSGIASYKQDMGDAGFVSVRYGMARGLDDRVAIFISSKNKNAAIEVLEGMGLN